MSGASHQRVKEVFFAVCDLPPEARAGVLERECAGDGSLRASVEALLKDDPGDTGRGVLPPPSESALVAAVLSEDDAGFEPVGEIAACRVIRKIGEGGMGSVYECEQDSPRRRVAIKVVRQGVADPAVHRRFRQEAEILGNLRHPNIARVYEAGATGVTFRNGGTTRCAYMMMELVEGKPLSVFSREQGLDLRARLELVIEVCDAVRHAHAMGIVHRDLKPANILVETRAEANGSAPRACPRILDFGIARMTGEQRTGMWLTTSPGQMLGTLAYMSPEQVVGDPTRVDTRSDVYSLGVILFELLAGELPLTLDSTSLAEAARIMRDVEPPELERVRPEYRGDLSTIVSKALRKQVEERYQSVADLGADLRRYLDDQPISARPATKMYVFRKFARRNRGMVIAAGVAGAALVIGAAAAGVGLVASRRANERMRESMEETQKQLARNTQVTGLMRKMLLSVKPSVAKGRDTSLMREVIESTVKRLDSGDLVTQPEVRIEMLDTLAETYAAIGDNEVALKTIEQAVEITKTVKDRSDPVCLHAGRTYASLLLDWGRHTEAIPVMREVLAGRAKSEPVEGLETASDHAVFATATYRAGDHVTAVASLRKVLEIRERLLGKDHPDVGAAIANLAGHLQNAGEFDEARRLLSEAIRIYQAQDAPVHITIVKNNLAALLYDMKRLDEAQAVAREAIALGATVYDAEHQQMGVMRYTLAHILLAQERPRDASEEFILAAAAFAKSFGAGNETSANAERLAAGSLAMAGEFSRAETILLGSARRGPAATGDPRWSRTLAGAMADLYDQWDSAEPEWGLWRARDAWMWTLAPVNKAP
ncbi:MAG: protein kinase domain-containing protein [Phycisphaerales bacterium]